MSAPVLDDQFNDSVRVETTMQSDLRYWNLSAAQLVVRRRRAPRIQ